MADEEQPPTDPKYIERAHRMTRRWAGVRGPGRPPEPDHSSVEQQIPSHSTVDAAGTVSEPVRQIPVLATCDVLVVGGGPSGLSAALSAQRAGADTMLVERFGCFGGVITTVGMETLAWYRYEGCIDSEGIGIEMERIAATHE